MHDFYGSMLSAQFHIGPPRDWNLSDRERSIAMFKLALAGYWRFLPAAFLAERAAFQRTAGIWAIRAPRTTVEDAVRRATADDGTPKVMMLPFLKVLRMHLLIFFFLFAEIVGLANFAIDTVVYAAYFFPWRLVNPPPAPYAWPTGPVERR